jgi:hypothetical protein
VKVLAVIVFLLVAPCLLAPTTREAPDPYGS